MKRVIITLFTVIFIICNILFVGCSQNNPQSSKEETPTIEEQIEGVWFAGTEPLDFPSSFLILSSTGDAYLSTDGTKYGTTGGLTYYEYSIYKGEYSIVQSNYIVLELTYVEYDVRVYSDPLECFNTNISPLNRVGNELELKIYKLTSNYLIEIGEQPLQYSKSTR